MISEKTPIIYKNFPGIIDSNIDKYGITFCPNLIRKPGKGFVFQNQSVREKDFIPLSTVPISSLEKVCENATDESLSKTISEELQDAWALLMSDEESASKDLDLSEILELCSSNSEPNNIWALYKCLCEDVHFEKKSDLTFALRTEQAIEEVNKQIEAKKQEALQRQEFITRLKNKKLSLPGDKVFMYEVEALAMGKTDKSKVLKDAGFKEEQNIAHKLLLDTGIWNVAKNPYPARFGLSMTNNNEQIPEPDDSNRVTMTTMSYAIDSPWSNDPDDAIAYDGQYLYVHVADPACAIMPDSPADKVAVNKGSTLYLPESHILMLSQKSLDDYALGLKPGLSRAFTFQIKLSENNDIEDVKVLKTFVPVTRLTFAQADEQQDNPGLAPLYEIARKNIKKREAFGAISINFPEIHISLTENGTDVPTVNIDQYDNEPFATDVVKECMLIAGEAAARFAYNNHIPFPYVTQSAPVLPNQLPEGLAGDYKIRRNMKGRTVGVTPTAHAGLGLPMYCQVTSPMRRYTDFIAHQQLHAYLEDRPLIDKDTLLQKISTSDIGASTCSRAERMSNAHWICVYLQQNPDWVGTATVVDFRNNMAVVIINELAMETTINLGSKAKLNDVIKLKVKNINITELNITFQLESNNNE